MSKFKTKLGHIQMVIKHSASFHLEELVTRLRDVVCAGEIQSLVMEVLVTSLKEMKSQMELSESIKSSILHPSNGTLMILTTDLYH